MITTFYIYNDHNIYIISTFVDIWRLKIRADDHNIYIISTFVDNIYFYFYNNLDHNIYIISTFVDI